MKKKIALVTGGAGFIGSHLVDLLVNKDYEVRIIDNFSGGHEKNIIHHRKNHYVKLENLNIIHLDENNNIFKDVDYIYHFAGKGDIVPSIENPLEYFHTNVLGTVKILECSKKSKVKKFVYAASSSCYGLADTPTDENHKIQTLYPYALSKYNGEQVCLHWNHVYNLPVISIRIFNAYGERVRTTGAYGAVFGVFFKQKLENKPFTIVGDGNQKRDFLYVTDVAKAFYDLSQSKYQNEIYNLGFGKPHSINELISLIDKNNPKVYIPERPGEPNITWANISKIQEHTKWSPDISFAEGVKIMINNLNDWKEAPLWDKNSIEIATRNWFKFMSNKNEI